MTSNLNWPWSWLTIKPWNGMSNISVEDMSLAGWLAVFFYLLWLYETWKLGENIPATPEGQLLRLKRRLGYSIFPWSRACTKIIVYLLMFFTYSQAIVWLVIGDELIQQFWETIGMLSQGLFQISFMVWSCLPAILQWWERQPPCPERSKTRPQPRGLDQFCMEGTSKESLD